MHDLQPPYGLGHVTAPVAYPFVPASVVISPVRVTGKVLIQGIIQPNFGIRDFTQKSDSRFADLMEHSVGVAAVGRVEVSRAAANLATFPGVLNAPLRDCPNLLALLR